MRLFVGGFPYTTTEEDLQTMFAAKGTVTSVSLVRERDTDRPRGFGFVDMPNDEEAKMAIQALHGQDMGGRNITVNEAKPREANRGRF